MASAKKVLAKKAEMFTRREPKIVSAARVLLHEMARHIIEEGCTEVYGRSINCSHKAIIINYIR